MRWFKPNLRGSIYAVFTSTMTLRPKSPRSSEVGIEDIRKVMLEMMAGVGRDRFPHFQRRVRYASDLESLWFLRGELMAVLASRYGEAAALEKLEEVSDLFGDLLPQGLRSRPSPLSSRNGN